MIAHEVHVLHLIRVLCASLKQHMLKEVRRPLICFRLKRRSNPYVYRGCALLRLWIMNNKASQLITELKGFIAPLVILWMHNFACIYLCRLNIALKHVQHKREQIGR